MRHIVRAWAHKVFDSSRRPGRRAKGRCPQHSPPGRPGPGQIITCASPPTIRVDEHAAKPEKEKQARDRGGVKLESHDIDRRRLIVRRRRERRNLPAAAQVVLTARLATRRRRRGKLAERHGSPNHPAHTPCGMWDRCRRTHLVQPRSHATPRRRPRQVPAAERADFSWIPECEEGTKSAPCPGPSSGWS